MEPVLSNNEARVLGCLIEKAVTTPEYYPMTLNAITNACNQRSNRDPVMNLTKQEVEDALSRLARKELCRKEQMDGDRSPKYRHRFLEKYQFSEGQTALVAVLMLRGDQTPGELKSRTERYNAFKSLQELETALLRLEEKTGGPFVKKLERAPGQKENRYRELLSRSADLQNQINHTVEKSGHSGGAVLLKKEPDSRIELLESEVQRLRREVQILNDRFEGLRSYIDDKLNQ